MHSSLGAPLTTARREPPAEAAEEVGDLGAAEDGGDVEAVSEDMVGLSPAAGQGRGVAEEAPDAGREIRGRVLEVDDARPYFLILRRRFLGEDANAVRGEDGAPQRLEGVARLLRAVEYDRGRAARRGPDFLRRQHDSLRHERTQDRQSRTQS